MTPATLKRQSPYTDMCKYLVNGLWPLNPFLEYDSFMFYMDATLKDDRTLISPTNTMYRELKWDARLRLQVILITVDLMKFSLVRTVLNYLQVFAFWLSKRWPLLAYWKYGPKNARLTNVPVCFKQFLVQNNVVFLSINKTRAEVDEFTTLVIFFYDQWLSHTC